MDKLCALNGGERRTAWKIIDAVAEAGHPGFEGTEWPEWVRRAIDSDVVGANPAMEKVLAERLAERRKKRSRESR